MKKIIGTLLILATLLTAAFLLTGCDGEVTKTHTAYVLGVHKNFPMPSPTTMYDSIYKSVNSGGKIAVVVSDGDADTLSYEAEFVRRESYTESDAEQKAENDTSSVVFEMLKLQPQAPECDLLQAISTAAKALDSYDLGYKVLYVYDSGLSTNGLLDFTDKSLLDTSPEDIAESLKKISALPDLNGITVNWIGFGQTCGDQTSLSSSHINKLRSIWEKVIYECGAVIKFDDAPISNGRNTYDLPDCSTVETYVDRITPDEGDSVPTETSQTAEIAE